MIFEATRNEKRMPVHRGPAMKLGRRRLNHAPARGLHYEGVKAVTTIPHQTPTRKSELAISISHAEPGMPILVNITCDRKQSDYWAEHIPTDSGIGVRFRKIWDGRAKDF